MTTPTPSPETPNPGSGLRSRRVLVAAALLALLLVAASVAIVLTRGGGGDEEDRADRDAGVACELLEELHADTTTLDDLDLEGPEIFELQAIGLLARAAGNADGAYDELGEAGEDVVSATARLRLDEMEESLGTLRSECDDVG